MEIDIPIESQLAAPTQPSGSNALRIPLRPPRAKQTTTCPECGKVLLRKTLQRHIETSHNKRTALRCPQCPKTFYRKDHLLRHRREKHEDAAETVECVYCGKQVRQRYLYEHWKGRKCTNAQVTNAEIAKGPTATSMVDPLVVAVSLCMLTTEAFSRSSPKGIQRGLLYDTKTITRQYLGEIWSLRDLVLYQTRHNVSKAFIAESRVTLDAMLCVQLFVLGFVDKTVFGWNSDERNAHGSFISSALCRFDERFYDFVLTYEAVVEHCWSNLPRDYLIQVDRKVMDIGAGYILGLLYLSNNSTYSGETALNAIQIPRSLKYGDWLVRKPLIVHLRQQKTAIYFAFEP